MGELAQLADRVAGLPDQLDPEHEDAKRLDMLLLNAQLGVLRGEPFERERRTVMALGGALGDQQSIPVIAEQLELIQDVQGPEWWVDVSYPMLEQVRNRLRSLVQLIERTRKTPLNSDFQDEIGAGDDVEGGAFPSNDFLQFRKKAEHFLKQNLGEAAVAKVRSGERSTGSDIAELQRILVAAGVGDDQSFEAASRQAGSFGLFVRSLIGLDRAAAKTSFADLLDDKRYTKNQITFVNLIIDELTSRGVVEPGRVYESPYDGVAPEGPETIFMPDDLNRLFDVIQQFANVDATA